MPLSPIPVRRPRPPTPSNNAVRRDHDEGHQANSALSKAGTLHPFGSETPASPLAANFGSLIAELVAKLEPLGSILKRYGISKAEFLRLRRTEIFVKAYKEQSRTFASMANAPERVRMKAQLLTEQLLDDMFTIASHPLAPPSARVSAFSQIKNLTGLEKPETAAPAQRFSLTINLTGNKQLHVEGASGTPAGAPLIEGDPSTHETGKPRRPLASGGSPYTASEDLLDSEPIEDEPLDDYDDDTLDFGTESRSLLPVPPARPWRRVLREEQDDDA